MNCDDVQNQLTAWIHGETEFASESPRALEAHLSACPTCRAAADELRRQHAVLRTAFHPQRTAAATVARRVGDLLRADSRPPQISTASRRPASWISLLLAAACGFLLAAIIFQPRNRPLQVAAPAADPSRQTPPLAQLVLSTGEVEVRTPGATNWSRVPAVPFACASGDAVRTPVGGLCEFLTAAGCVIRLNDQTEMTFRAADVVSLKNGELWCSVPQDAALEVLADEVQRPKEPQGADEVQAKATPEPTGTLPKFTCPSGSNLLTSCDSGVVCATSAAGDVAVETKSGRQQLKAGQAARIVDGHLAGSVASGDPLLEARWMQPLLVRKGHDDGELAGRVNDLLARVGRAKVSYLYEQEIRSLGEYCVLPLVRYVQSDKSRTEPSQRIRAMRIIADLAPAWAVRDLIDLLADDDADVRYHAAAALKRLTAETQGREPDAWRADPAECAPTRAQWLAWWKQNARRFPIRDPAAKT